MIALTGRWWIGKIYIDFPFETIQKLSLMIMIYVILNKHVQKQSSGGVL